MRLILEEWIALAALATVCMVGFYLTCDAILASYFRRKAQFVQHLAKSMKGSTDAKAQR